MSFTFRGVPLSVVQEEIYGIMMHGWKDMRYAASQRAIVAKESLHGMLSKCKKGGIFQPAFLCRIFDVLVLPMLSYGAHVWGPSMFQKFLFDPFDSKNDVERVHWEFLRPIAGMGESVHKESLYKEFGRYPFMRQWLVLAARWWNSMVDKETCLLPHKAFLEDLILMKSGCTTCWSWQFLEAMTTIKVRSPKEWKPGYIKGCDNLICMTFDEEIVSGKAEEWFDRTWDTCNDDPS